MRSTLFSLVAFSLLTVTGCRTENCPAGMERLEDGVCHDILNLDTTDTGASFDTGYSGFDDEE